MNEFFQPVLEAFRDQAIQRAPEVVGFLAVTFTGLVTTMVVALRKLALAKLDQLRIASLAGVRIAEAKAEPPPFEISSEMKKKIADGAAEALLKALVPKSASSRALAQLPSAVQNAWEQDEVRKSAPTVPETPSAKAKADLGS